MNSPSLESSQEAPFLPSAASTPRVSAVSAPVRLSLSSHEDPSNGNGTACEVSIESSYEDVRESSIVNSFITKTCGCKYGPGSTPCTAFLNRTTIEKHRADNMELSKDELDLVVLAQIRAHRKTSDQETLRSSHHATKEDKSRSQFFISGVRICLTTFLFIHCMSRFRYEGLVHHFEEHGVCTRQHGNMKRLPGNATPQEDITRLTTFIKNYARAHAMPLPGRVPGHRDKVMILPSDVTKAEVYIKYKEACTQNSWNAVGRSAFYDLWSRLLSHISVSKPSSDLCFTCQQNSLAIQQSACMLEAEKTRRLEVAQEHIQLAHEQRSHYNEQVEAAQQACKSAAGGTPTIGHYSYDFAQQVHVPFDAQQTGPEYFKTARKCGVFGVCNDGRSVQVNYLIDEADNPGKGADCVISLIHHYLEHHGENEKSLYFHADNCTAQNKNNATIQYFMWRVMTQKQESIELSFMLVGHTKFSPDRFFGLFKKAYRRSSVSTVAEVAQVVEKSTHAEQNIPQLVRDERGGQQVTFYKWTAYLIQFFRAIPNILSYHKFRVSSAEPGVVYLREFCNSDETKINILKSEHNNFPGFPDEILPPGLDLNREWYLYEHVRPHCKSTLAADITCPKPSQPKSSQHKPSQGGTSTSAEDETAIPPAKRRLCGICRQPGHNKKSCPTLK